MKMKKQLVILGITILVGVCCMSGCFESEEKNHTIHPDDADGDGLSDEQEWVLGTNRTNPDSEGDGVFDFFETINGTAIDTDDDNIMDTFDDDDDGDSVLTADEHPDDNDDGNPSDAVDADADDVPDYLDTDDDNDSILTSIEETYSTLVGNDVDTDGLLNYQDTDSDNDTKPDQVEGTGDSDGDGVPNFLDANDNDGPFGDFDGDGVTNEEEGYSDLIPPDTDDDGISDYLDPDANGGSNGSTTDQTRFIGSWYNQENDREQWIFYGNGSLKKTSLEFDDLTQEQYLFIIWALYEVNATKVCFKDQDAPINLTGICYDYEFSYNETLLIISVNGAVGLSLHKV